jgi:hypothetical protein
MWPFKKNKEIDFFKSYINRWRFDNGYPELKGYKLSEYIGPSLHLIKVLEKRMSDAHKIIFDQQEDLHVKKSCYPNQIKLITKCGCSQFLDGEGIGVNYVVNLVGGEKFIQRIFRFQRQHDGLSIYQEI